MGTRGKQVSWVVIGVAIAVIMGYLAKYGGPSYARGTSAAPPPAGLAAPDSSAATPVSPPPAETSKTSSDQASSAESCPALESAPPPVPKAKASPPAPGAKPGAAPVAAAVPAITFLSPEHSFGTVYQEQKVKHDYVFTNTGKAPLKITDVTTTCGCAIGEIPSKEFAPGESGAIPLTFDSGRLRDRVTKHVYVLSNDPASPRTVLTMTADVKIEADVSPTGVYFSRLAPGQSLERSVVLRPVEVKSLKLLAVESSDPHIALTRPLEQVRPAGDGSYTLVFRVGPYSEPTRVDAKVKITTDLQHQAVLTIPFYGRIVKEEPHVPADANKLAP